ncbi:hypothetical protein [Amycolatopsis magusensis]|uniref:Uncharacterized protein n=1 Tax=Amycolatopsis magusensis TaxID=882444 RepID=A0ABS4PTK0_9PSEU|nr:hypothetical protein [Amycolatopsis magusensis]MBP2182749.1 hypothetical protein [Amycolatopsis magusensis]
MSTQDHEVLARRGSDHRACQLRSGGTRGAVLLEFDGPTGHLAVAGYDVLDALTKLRTALEEHGWLLAVQGARLNAHPSGLLRDSTNGKRVYLMSKERGPYPAVDTLAPADPGQVATLEAQARHVRAIFGAFRKPSQPEGDAGS